MTLLRQYGLYIVLLALLLGNLSASAQPVYRGKPRKVEHPAREHWVDSTYDALSMYERIGQLFMVPAYSGGKDYNEEAITSMIASRTIGGIIYMQGWPARQAALTNKYQRMAHVPLLIAQDAEWGVGMRLDSVQPMPRQMMMGATRDTGIVARMGRAVGAQCRRLGVHINFAPDVDVNNDPANPVINSRSFGEEKYWVAKLGRAYVRGMQQQGIIACAKHFPGHGNTSTDSHADLPLIARSVQQLDTVELYPFRQLIAEGVKSVMIGHLEVPALDTAQHVPTSLSYNTITGLLKGQLHYGGLVFTDGLNMSGVTKYFKDGEAELRAFMAGNDMLLMPKDHAAATARLRMAVDSGVISPERLEHSVKKILAAKYDAGLAQPWQDLDTKNIAAELNKQVDSIRAQVARAAITLVRDDNQMLKRMSTGMRLAYVGINATGPTPLYSALEDKYDNVRAHWLPKGTKGDSVQAVLDDIAGYNTVVIGIHKVSFTPGGNYGLGDEAVALLQKAACMRNVMIVLMGNAYAMQYVCAAPSVLVGYEDDTTTQRAMANVLMRKNKAKGKLPVTACANGLSICLNTYQPKLSLREPAHKLRHAFAGEAGVQDPDALDKLDRFIARCLAEGAFPGCRILAARNGQIFYDHSFGYLDYYKTKKVDSHTVYDVASCTKVLATTLSVMKLYEQGKIDLDKTIGDYLPQARGTNKEQIRIRQLLLHEAGLKGWIPFYKDITDDGGKIMPQYVRSNSAPGYSIQMARNTYLRDDYIDTMWAKIYASNLDNKGKMVYSDLSFYFMAAIVQQVSGKRVDQYAADEFYKPLGLKYTTYNPTDKMDTVNIAPTEIDMNFRPGVLRGYVHDPGAAMLGGVGGHAGLFSTAEEVAVLMQLLLNKGSYGGKKYLQPATVDMFTAYNSRISHRGLGFDKAVPKADEAGGAGERWSGLTFGHQGFTGTCVWADPASGTQFIFLSNRVYPSSANTKISKMSVRTVAQDYIYEALGIPVNTTRPDVYLLQTGQLK